MRKNFFKILFRCLICIFAMITVTYSWFSFNSKYVGPSMRYSEKLVISTNQYTINTYLGTEEVEDTFVYSDTPIKESESFSKIAYPGKKIAFKTTIQNNDPDNLANLSLYLDNIIYDKVLKNYIFFGVSQPYSLHVNYSEKAIDGQETGKEILGGAVIADHLTIEAGDTVDIYWYIYIDTELSNEGKNTKIDLDGMQILLG